MEATSSVTLEQGRGHCVYLHAHQEHIAHQSHRTLASSIFIESMFPSPIMLYLFEGSYLVSATCSDAHPSHPSPNSFVFISHIFTLSFMFCVN